MGKAILTGLGLLAYLIIYKPGYVIYRDCCSCSSSDLRLDSIIKTWIHNITLDCSKYGDCSMFGCALSYYVIPIELVAVIVILIFTYFIKRKVASKS